MITKRKARYTTKPATASRRPTKARTWLRRQGRKAAKAAKTTGRAVGAGLLALAAKAHTDAAKASRILANDAEQTTIAFEELDWEAPVWPNISLFREADTLLAAQLEASGAIVPEWAIPAMALAM